MDLITPGTKSAREQDFIQRLWPMGWGAGGGLVGGEWVVWVEGLRGGLVGGERWRGGRVEAWFG